MHFYNTLDAARPILIIIIFFWHVKRVRPICGCTGLTPAYQVQYRPKIYSPTFSEYDELSLSVFEQTYELSNRSSNLHCFCPTHFLAQNSCSLNAAAAVKAAVRVIAVSTKFEDQQRSNISVFCVCNYSDGGASTVSRLFSNPSPIGTVTYYLCYLQSS